MTKEEAKELNRKCEQAIAETLGPNAPRWVDLGKPSEDSAYNALARKTIETPFADRRCHNCRWSDKPHDDTELKDMYLECHAALPTESGFPEVSKQDFCSQWMWKEPK